jgi:alkylation response protein AidB-like acyl-CoA dehydrogenase
MVILRMLFFNGQLFYAEIACRVAAQAVQIFGGMRYKKDFPVGGVLSEPSPVIPRKAAFS